MEEKTEPKIKARVKNTTNIYIHNDLSQAATYFADIITKKTKDGIRDGIMLDGMACAVMVAFAFEANISFMGSYLLRTEKLKDWNECQPLSKKMRKVFAVIDITTVLNVRPLSSMMKMKQLRDTFAHGKPFEREEDQEIEATQKELEGGMRLAADWEKDCRSESVHEALSDLDDLWKLMITKSGVPVIDTMTHGSGSITLIK